MNNGKQKFFWFLWEKGMSIDDLEHGDDLWYVQDGVIKTILIDDINDENITFTIWNGSGDNPHQQKVISRTDRFVIIYYTS